MGNGIRVKYNHVLQNKNRARSKSYDKYNKVLNWYMNLLIREKEEGNTKWIIKTKEKALLRFKKYGITNEMFAQYLKKKGKEDLLINK